jgi:hypothetical protein
VADTVSYRLEILKKLTTLLQDVSFTYNDIAYDIGAKVYRGRRVYGGESELPLISLLEAPRNDAGIFGAENKSRRAEKWSLLIQGWVDDDKKNPTDPAYAFMQVVEDRLFRVVEEPGGVPTYPDDYLLGRTISGMTIYPGVVSPPLEQVSSKAFFYLPVDLQIARPK